MKKPINIQIIKRKDEDYFRFRYRIGTTTVTSMGFQTRKELANIIEDDDFFRLELSEIGDESE